MSISFPLWALIPAGLMLGAGFMFWLGERQTGMFAGLGEMLVGLSLLLAAAAFMVGRWLA